jgi:hypothetical protein
MTDGSAKLPNTLDLRFLISTFYIKNLEDTKMKNYRDSDYAANKNAKGIVCRFANQIIEITLEDYLRENPDKNEADFTELKSLSDEIYLKQVRAENA